MGDVLAIIDQSGTEIVRYVYDAWGNHKVFILQAGEFFDISKMEVYNMEGEANRLIANLNPIRYRSYYFDTDTGLFYTPGRYYDPEVGRWINADDISYLEPETINGLNLYAYCGNNPVMNIDPDGHAFISILLGFLISAAIMAGVSAAVGSQVAGGIGFMATGGSAIAAGIGALAFGPVGWIIGGITIIAGAVTMAVGAAEIGEGVSGYNFIRDGLGISQTGYDVLKWTSYGVSIVGSLASSAVTALGRAGVKILQIGRIKGVRAQPGHFGVRYKNGVGQIKSLEIHPRHNGHGIHLQRNTWWLNMKGYEGQYYRAFAKHLEIFKFWKGWH